jgi:hypothetical protein
MVGFVNPHKVVVWRNAFSTLANAQNEYMKIESFGHGRSKHRFSQVQGYLDLWKILKLALLPKKRATRKKKVVVLEVKKEDEKNERAKNIGQVMKYYISLHYEEIWSLNLSKVQKKKKHFSLFETFIIIIIIIIYRFLKITFFLYLNCFFFQI